MTMVAATVIAYDNDMPYFLVQEVDGKEQFMSVKVHRHHEQTSLGVILDSFSKAGVKDFDNWRLGELSTIEHQDGKMAPLYSFHVKEYKALQNELKDDLVFKDGDELSELLKTIQPSTFATFDE
ncbi:hypothetical protein G6R29_04825 [Fructobacillus sp. M2-14]|uniref:Uncharacterized protein n=1 Tax=Fructobacillus broussonetiae TaxID=2713173 RepID=A0ABS5R0I7_9LACO|nr:hypothetical protein [Fructobacillus broussonetiae]MBS9338949.1 hypothetical protein [Fructobacillus broussonetiae]